MVIDLGKLVYSSRRFRRLLVHSSWRFNRGPGTWGLTISLGRDQNGKRIRRYFTFKGTKSEAERELRRLLTEFEGGPALSTARVRVRDWLPRWIDEYGTVQSWRQSTIDRYTGVVNAHLIPHLGALYIDDITPRHVQRLQVALPRGGMNPKGVHLVRTVLSGAITYAITMGYARHNPVKDVKPPPIPRKEIVPPSSETVSAMLELAANEEHALFSAIFLQVCTGIRRGEVLALTWAHVDLDKAEIRIEKSVGRRSTGVIADPPKSESGNRTIRLPEVAVQVLRRHRELQDAHKIEFADIYEDNDLVFADEIGLYINPMNLTRAVRALGKRVGHPKMRNHDLRHFHVSQALELNVPMAEVSARVGHANPSITWAIYAHLLPGSEPRAPDAIDDAMEQFWLDDSPETSQYSEPEDGGNSANC